MSKLSKLSFQPYFGWKKEGKPPPPPPPQSTSAICHPNAMELGGKGALAKNFSKQQKN